MRNPVIGMHGKNVNLVWPSWKAFTNLVGKLARQYLGEVIFSFSMLTVNADGHSIMQHFHKPDDEKRSIIVLNEANYLPWLRANQDQARHLLKVAPDHFLMSEAAPR